MSKKRLPSELIIGQKDAPPHLFNIPELNFSDDLLTKRLGGPWFKLGAFTLTTQRDNRNVEDVVERRSFLLPTKSFSEIFNRLDSIGNVIGDLGKPGGCVTSHGTQKTYKYAAFHEFNIGFTSAIAEPLVFLRSTSTDSTLLINPDVWLFLELEQPTLGRNAWWDPRRGVEVLREQKSHGEQFVIVEIRTDYLLQYLKARQMSLIIGHYRHLHFFDPPQVTIDTFVEGDVSLGSPKQATKAIFENWGLRKDPINGAQFLLRRLHLWFEIKPPKIDIEHPWAEDPLFDPYTFLLPMQVGPVAPARWKNFRRTEGRIFEGNACDFMDRVYFRQEVLTKYEGTSSFSVADDGSVSCYSYWGLTRSTSRLGNEMIATAIGDFAEGVPFEEWPHWQQYVVEPPSLENLRALHQEQTVPTAVNSVVEALEELNNAFRGLAASYEVTDASYLWQGSLSSLAGRQLKWVYPTISDDDEFLKRATLLSTLVLDALEPKLLRNVVRKMGKSLDMNDETPPRPIGTRKLLQRVTLIAELTERFRSDAVDMSSLLMQAEGKQKAGTLDLQVEFDQVGRLIDTEFAPLAFLYDLRTHGGVAHPSNSTKAAEAAVKLSLPMRHWRRAEYLRLLNLVAQSIRQIASRLDTAAWIRSN